MKTLISFTIAMVAWVSYEASATETSCTIGSRGSIFLPHQHHALIGHSFLNQSGTVRIKCMMLCWRHSRCLSFNHDDISGICQLNDANKEEFPESYEHDDGFSYFDGSSDKAKPLPEEVMFTATTEQEPSQAPETSSKHTAKVSMELSTPITHTTSAKADDFPGNRVKTRTSAAINGEVTGSVTASQSAVITTHATGNAPATSDIPVTSFSCVGRVDGFYADPYSCTMFYRCNVGVAHHSVCPLGTHFNETDYRCTLPEDANCNLQQVAIW